MAHALMLVSAETIVEVVDEATPGGRRYAALRFDGASVVLGALWPATDEEVLAAAAALGSALDRIAEAARSRLAADASGAEEAERGAPDDSRFRAEMRDAGRGGLLQ